MLYFLEGSHGDRAATNSSPTTAATPHYGALPRASITITHRTPSSGATKTLQMRSDQQPKTGHERCIKSQAARGLLDGSERATPWSRKSRASHAGEGAFSPMEAILSCTLIGPWSKPERSRAARTSRAWERAASGRRAGLERGRRDRGSSTAAGPSRRARRRRT